MAELPDVDGTAEDPLYDSDPWRGAVHQTLWWESQGASASSQQPSGGGAPQGSPAGHSHGGQQRWQWNPRAQDWVPGQVYFGDTSTDAPPSKVIHDNPPTWDGRDPERQLEPYLKLLEGWLATTRTLKRQRGMVIMNYASGDLRLIINELDVDTLTSEDGDEKVIAHIRESFQEFLDKRLPKVMERAIFPHDGRRGKPSR